MLAWLAGALAALLGGGSWVTWRVSPVARSARAAGEAVDAVASELGAARAARVLPETALVEEAGRYARACRAERRRTTPLEALREAGARKVRLSALREAGLQTLAQVADAPASRLKEVDGIGPLSVRRLRKAIRRLEAELAAEAPGPPGPALEEPGAPLLVQRGLSALEARAALGDVIPRLEQEWAGLEQRRQQVRREAGWLRFVLGSAAAADRQARVARARELEQAARTSLEQGTAAEAARRRQRLATLPAPPTGREALQRVYAERQAELVAVLEGALAPGGPAAAPLHLAGGARLPEDIVARVLAQPLQVDGLAVVLRRYQDFGARFLLAQERTILGDDMGLGKTLQALAAMEHLRASGQGGRFLVVAPATVVPGWAREIGTRTPLACHVLHGSRKEAALQRWLVEGGVAVTSYATLRRLAPAPLLPAPLDLLVADEAHYLKNPAASRTAAVADLLARSRRACLMTGTPIENTLDEFRALVRLVRPGLLAAEPGDDGVRADPQAFQRQVAAVYLRRNQPDVLHELPERLEKEEWVELGHHERGAYVDAVAAGNVMAMRRATAVGDWQRARAGRPRSAKLDRIADLVEEHRRAGRKVLVFSFFLDVLAALERRLEVLGAIHGEVPTAEREALLERFRDEPGHAVLLGQVTAAGVGLNLQAASVVVLVEPQWKPSTEEQAIARAHRMGQTAKVVVHRMLARDSVDERIVELLAGKQELFERYARPSAVKAASRHATEAALARLVVETEQGRLAQARGQVALPGQAP